MERCGADPTWLVCVRQLLAGLMFLAYALAFDRDRLLALRADRAALVVLGTFCAQLLYMQGVADLGPCGRACSPPRSPSPQP